MATPKSTRISLFNHVVDRIQDIIPTAYSLDLDQTKAFFESSTPLPEGGHVNRVGVYVEVTGNFMNFEVHVIPLFDPLDQGIRGGLPKLAYPLTLSKQDILNADFDTVIEEWTTHHIHDNMEKTVHEAFDDMHPQEQQEDLADELLGTEKHRPQEESMPDTQETVALDREQVQQHINETKAQQEETTVARNALTLDIVYKALKLHASGVNEDTIAEVLSNDSYIIDSETVSTLITKVKNAGFQAV